jgi:hypothetical protein
MVSSDWRVNYGFKPVAELVNLRFADRDDGLESLEYQDPNDWYWDVFRSGGRITHYQILERQASAPVAEIHYLNSVQRRKLRQ